MYGVSCLGPEPTFALQAHAAMQLSEGCPSLIQRQCAAPNVGRADKVTVKF